MVFAIFFFSFSIGTIFDIILIRDDVTTYTMKLRAHTEYDGKTQLTTAVHR